MHTVAEKSVSVESGLLDNGWTTIFSYTNFSRIHSMIDQTVSLAVDNGFLNKKAESSFWNISLSAYLEKSIFMLLDKKMSFNLGAGPYLGFEFLSNDYLNLSDKNYFVPGISTKATLEYIILRKKNFICLFFNISQNARFKSKIGSNFYRATLGIKIII